MKVSNIMGDVSGNLVVRITFTKDEEKDVRERIKRAFGKDVRPVPVGW